MLFENPVKVGSGVKYASRGVEGDEEELLSYWVTYEEEVKVYSADTEIDSAMLRASAERPVAFLLVTVGSI